MDNGEPSTADEQSKLQVKSNNNSRHSSKQDAYFDPVVIVLSSIPHAMCARESGIWRAVHYSPVRVLKKTKTLNLSSQVETSSFI